MDKIAVETAYVAEVVNTDEWVEWDELVQVFTDYGNNFIGAKFKPLFTFRTLPAAPGEEFNTALIAVVRLESGWQSVVMSRPLPNNAKNFSIHRGFTAAIDLALAEVGKYFAVQSYIKQG